MQWINWISRKIDNGRFRFNLTPGEDFMTSYDRAYDIFVNRYPIRYPLFLVVERIEFFVEDIIRFPITVSDWFRNGVTDRTDIIKTGLTRFDFHERDDKVLHGCFNELVQYVEQDCAWMHHIFEDQEGLPLRKKTRLWKFRNPFFNCPEDGIKHLEWQIGVIGADYPDEQSPAWDKKKIIELYNWWVYIRPNRIDPFSLDQDCDFCFSLEEKQNREDDEKLKELIDIRRSLWT